MRSIPITEFAVVFGAVVLASATPNHAWAADVVDRTLVGTWQLEWPRPALYWDVRAGDNGCLFRSGLSNLDSLTITLRRNQGQFFQNVGKSATTFAIDVPGVGDQAWVKAGGAGTIEDLSFLRGDLWVRLSASLQPELTRDDIPALANLARAVDRRMSGFTLPPEQLTDAQRAGLQKIIEKTQRHSGSMKQGSPP